MGLVLKYKVKDEFSKMLVASIPKKVDAMLSNMGVKSMGEGQICSEINNLSVYWNFSKDNGSLTLTGLESNEPLDINFQGRPFNAHHIEISDERLTDISNNLEYFTKVENAIYNQLAYLQKKVELNANKSAKLETEQ